MNGKELFRGLSYISRRYIDEAEFGTLSSAQNAPAPAARARLRRPDRKSVGRERVSCRV